MTWKSHSAIAAAITLPFAPALVPVAVIGSTAPDWSEWILKFFGIRIQHRGVTHYVYIPLAILLVALFAMPISAVLSATLAAFGAGYLSHWVADGFTVSGVPVSGSSAYRVHFFGGRFRTGVMGEYIFAFGLLALSVFFFAPSMHALTSSLGASDARAFNAWFVDYRDLYDKHIIDEYEAVLTRFKFF